MDARAHWDAVHADNTADEVSWWQTEPATSLRLLARVGVGPAARVLDVGCGQHGLAGALLARGQEHVAALDISREAIRRARERLGDDAARVEWIEADVRAFLPGRPFDVWHDRAVYHFLVDPADRESYAHTLHRALKPGGHAIVATFAPDGPPSCSGLPVARHDAADIARELDLRLIADERETHVTPWGSEQRFVWALLRRD